jgi:hypothetical protein
VNKPKAGFERVIEHYCKATESYSFGWFLLHDTEVNRAVLFMSVFNRFEEQQAMWTKVVSSLDIGNSTETAN